MKALCYEADAGLCNIAVIIEFVLELVVFDKVFELVPRPPRLVKVLNQLVVGEDVVDPAGTYALFVTALETLESRLHSYQHAQGLQGEISYLCLVSPIHLDADQVQVLFVECLIHFAILALLSAPSLALSFFFAILVLVDHKASAFL